MTADITPWIEAARAAPALPAPNLASAESRPRCR